VEKRTLNRRIKRTFYRGALPFDKIGLKAMFNRFGTESPKSFGSFAKRTRGELVFLQLRKMLDKTNRSVLLNESGMATARFSFFLFKKKQNGGRHCSWSVKRFNNEIKRTRTAFSDNL